MRSSSLSVRARRGFTLIETVIVVLVIGIMSVSAWMWIPSANEVGNQAMANAKLVAIDGAKTKMLVRQPGMATVFNGSTEAERWVLLKPWLPGWTTTPAEYFGTSIKAGQTLVIGSTSNSNSNHAYLTE